MENNPKVDLCFLVTGRNITVDHGFDLYSAISRINPDFHEAEGIGIKPIRGRYIGDGLLDIHPNSWLTIRLRTSVLPGYINLAGKTIKIKDHSIQIGVPQTRSLVAGSYLYAHLVTTRNGQDQQRFENEISRQMAELKVNGECNIGERKTFTIHDKKVVGYSMTINELSDEDSILIQEHGLGGRRKMGCGFFEPVGNDR
jgi:CRISPR-associated protein Cas6